MPLFMLSWPSDASWVVDAPDEGEALARGKERIGSAPALCRELPPSLLSFDVVMRPDPKESDLVVVELVPDEAAAELLSVWEEEANEAAADTELPEGAERCESTADTDEDEEVRCSLPDGHEGHHVGGSQDCLEWS
jgi:hypothetical protein